jgi:hypothetical protein
MNSQSKAGQKVKLQAARFGKALPLSIKVNYFADVLEGASSKTPGYDQ